MAFNGWLRSVFTKQRRSGRLHKLKGLFCGGVIVSSLILCVNRFLKIPLYIVPPNIALLCKKVIRKNVFSRSDVVIYQNDELIFVSRRLWRTP